jgi:hypothetical protein
MSTQTVQGLDGRTWLLRSRIEWSRPATEELSRSQFEHDVDGGRGAAIMILSALFLFWVILVVWTPDQVHVPWFLWPIAALVVLFFPFRWFLRRPRTLVAETAGGYDSKAELWTGSVRGGAKAREEMRIVKRRIETEGTPSHVDSSLHPVN